MWDGGVATDNADHRFFGLGIVSSQQRYQVPSGGAHVFYAATSATASTELFKIAGDGNSVTNGAMISRTSCVDSWRTPTFQGAWMGWNRGGAFTNGQTTFANQQGLGGGGWEWVNLNNSNVQTPSGSASMTLSRDGDLTIRGNLNAGGGISIGSGSIFNTYEEYNFSSTFNGTAATSNVRFSIVQIGKQVTLRAIDATTFTSTTSDRLISTTPFPMRFTPNSYLFFPIMVKQNTFMTSGVLFINDVNGNIEIKAPGNANFTSGQVNGFYQFSVTWTIS